MINLNYMKILADIIRFLINITVSISSLFIFIYYFNDEGLVDYFVFAIPFLISLNMMELFLKFV